MLLIKISNTKILNLKLHHGLCRDWPILLKSKMNFTKVSAKKKIHTKEKVMKDNSKHTVMLYLLDLGRQKNLITKRQQRKTPGTSMADRKGTINKKSKSDESISSLLIDN